MRHASSLVGVVAAIAMLAAPSVAKAGVLEACSNVSLAASVDCKVEPPGIDCKTKCTPISLETVCAKQLFTECAPKCTATITEQEVTVCANQCVNQCTVNPGGFNCNVNCGGTCSGNCSAQCSGNANMSQCMASCQATCTGYCDGQCKLVLPSMDCQQKCQTSCKGVIEQKVNWECHEECQTVERYTSCETTLKGGCETACQTKDGALFCSGQWVDYGQSLQNCVDALKNMKINVNWSFQASMDVEGCAVGGRSVPKGALLLLLGFVPLVFRRRRH